jgi:RNA polymerase sigma-70 factor (ECF subfamily)
MTTSIRQYTSEGTASGAASNQSNPLGLLDRHGDYLYHYALLRLRDSATAENAVQETLLAAMQASKKQQNVSSGNTFQSERKWLMVILNQKLVGHYRNTYRRNEVADAGEVLPDDDLFEKDGEWAGHWREDMAPTNWKPAAFSVSDDNNFWLTLRRCLSELSPNTAMAFTLREFDGLSSEEICDLLEISADDLRTKLNRARLRLSHLIRTQFFLSRPLDPSNAGHGFQKSTRQKTSLVSRHGNKYISTIAGQSAVRILR